MDIDTKLTLNAGSQTASDLAFSATFPLPYRSLFLIGAGILGWATNLHFLSVLGVDTGYALDIPRRSSHHALPSAPHNSRCFNSFAHPGSLFRPVYKIFAYYATWTGLSWFLFRLWTDTKPDVIDEYKTMPTVTAVLVLAVLFCPFNILYKAERTAFLRGLIRCVASPPHSSIYFSDVILADIFTSYAKVIGDLWIAGRMLLPGGSLANRPDEHGLLYWIIPFLMSLPYIVRFRQCILEYGSSNGTSRSIFNALKYATAFPVIFLSAAQRLLLEDAAKYSGQHNVWHGEYQLFRLWLLSVFINSVYSFWWDVTNDWGLDLLRPASWSPPLARHSPNNSMSPPRPLVLPTLRANGKFVGSSSAAIVDLTSPRPLNYGVSSHQFGLRRRLLFGDPLIYYIAILFNFILRFTWSLKLSSHLHNVTDMESGVFVMEALEVLRRWVWVFLRVEWEVLRKQEFVAPNGHRLGEDSEELELLLRGETSDSGG